MAKQRTRTPGLNELAREPLSIHAGTALVFALVLIAFSPAIFAGFIWDDPDHILNNVTLRSLHGLWTMWIDRTSLPQWYPLTHATFWIEYHLWGVNPAGYHIDNLLLHATSGALLWRLLKKLEVPGAFLAASIFAVHPVMVESVAWITERKNTLSLLIYLLAAHAYLPIALHHEQQDPDGDFSRHQNTHSLNRYRYFLSLALFIAALLSKSVTSTFPAAILLIIWWKRDRIRMKDVFRLVPFFVVAILASLDTGYLERTHVIMQSSAIPELQFTAVQRVMIAGRAIWFYASKLVWPHDLTFIYPRWNSIDDRATWNLLFGAMVIIAVVTLVALRRRIGRGPLTSALFFCGTLVPALGFVSVYPMRFSFVADHFQYHASIGLIVLIAAIAATRFDLSKRRSLFVAATMIVALTALTFRRTQDFDNAKSLWADTLAKNDRSWLVDTRLAVEMHNSGDDESAAALYLKALELNPNWFETHMNAAQAFRYRGDLNRAIAELREATRLNPNYTESHYRIATIEQQRGRLDAAAAEYRDAISADANNLDARTDYGLMLLAQNKSDEAIDILKSVTQIIPNVPSAWQNLGAAQIQSGKREEAIQSFRRALQIDSNFVPAQRALAATGGSR